MTIDWLRYARYGELFYSDGTLLTDGTWLVRLDEPIDLLVENPRLPREIVIGALDASRVVVPDSDAVPLKWILPPNIETPACPECYGSGMAYEECLECGGYGFIECPECHQETACGECDGEGTTVSKTEKCAVCGGTGDDPFGPSMQLNGAKFCGRIVSLLNLLNVKKWHLQEHRLWFSFDGGEGVAITLSDE